MIVNLGAFATVKVAGIITEQLLEIILDNKWQILAMLGLFLCLCSCSLFNFIFGGTTLSNYPGIYEGLPVALQGYLAPGFNNSAAPFLSPFAGALSVNTVATSGYHDLDYFKSFGRWHEGVDLVPSANYYEQDQAYKLYGDVVIYAVCTGKADSLRDGAGANYIYLSCADKVHGVMLVHNKTNFIPLGKSAQVIAGQPIAIMGSTGHSTGAHVHFAVHDLKTRELINPLPFLLGTQHN